MYVPEGFSGDGDESGRFVPERFTQCQSNMEHEELCERLRKTLYYGKMPSMDRPSLAMTELTVELLQDVSQREFGRVDMYYAAELSREVCASPCSVVVAMLYMKRLQKSNPAYLRQISSSELLLVTMMVASKYLYDEGEMEEPLNDEWANSANVDVDEINFLERAFLSAIDWKLYVSRTEYWNALKELETRIAWKRCKERGGSATYTDLNVLLGNGCDLSAIMLSVISSVCEVFAVCCMTYCACLLPLAASPSALLAAQPLALTAFTVAQPLALAALSVVAQVPHVVCSTSTTIMPHLPLTLLSEGLQQVKPSGWQGGVPQGLETQSDLPFFLRQGLKAQPSEQWQQAEDLREAEWDISGVFSRKIPFSLEDTSELLRLAGTNGMGTGTNEELATIADTATNNLAATAAASVTSAVADGVTPSAARVYTAEDTASAAAADAKIPFSTPIAPDIAANSHIGDHSTMIDLPGAVMLEWVCVLLASAVSNPVTKRLCQSSTNLQASCCFSAGWNTKKRDAVDENSEQKCQMCMKNLSKCRRSSSRPRGPIRSTYTDSEGLCDCSTISRNGCNRKQDCAAPISTLVKSECHCSCSINQKNCSIGHQNCCACFKCLPSKSFHSRRSRSALFCSYRRAGSKKVDGGFEEDFAPFVANLSSYGKLFDESQGPLGEMDGSICCRKDVKNGSFSINGRFSNNCLFNDELKVNSDDATCDSCSRIRNRRLRGKEIFCVWCNSSCNKDKVNNRASASIPNGKNQRSAVCSKLNKHADVASSSSTINPVGCLGLSDSNSHAETNCNKTDEVAKGLGSMNKSGTIGLNYHPTTGFSKSLVFEHQGQSSAFSNSEPGWLWKPIDVAG